MRQIKFRGKLKRTNQYQPEMKAKDYIYGGVLVCYEKQKAYIIEKYENKLYEVYFDTVSQFTGVNDKNGIEIYENDIVTYKVAYPCDKDHVLHNKLHKSCVSFNNGSFSIAFSDPSTIEVIGNVHDNLESLNNKQNVR